MPEGRGNCQRNHPGARGPARRGAGAVPSVSVERQVVGALGSIGTATLASRVLGFVRDVVVALAFGAGPVTDAFFVAFRIPNMLRRLLAEGALSTAVIPVFTEYATTRPRPEFLGMLRAVFGVAILTLGATTLLGVAAAPWLLRLIAPGFTSDPEQLGLAVLLTRVMFPYLPLVGLAALGMGALHVHNRFFAAALGPALLNVAMIGGVLLLAGHLTPPILGLALGVLAGGVAQLLVQLPSLRASGVLVPPSGDLAHPALQRLARLLLPAVFGLAAVQAMVFVNTLLASLLAPGSISFLYYADRVMEFPLGVFAIALASAALPTMARQAAAGDTTAFAATLGFTLRLGLFIAVPSTVGLVLLRQPIVRVLFERGEFGTRDTEATAAALAAYAVGLAGLSGARIVAQAFYAVGAAGTAVRVGVAAVVANIVAAVALMQPLAHVGLALAASIGGYVNLGLLLWFARRRFGPLGGRTVGASAGRTLGASVPLALWCLALQRAWPAAPSTWLDAAWLAAAVGGGAGVFWIASVVLKVPERTALLTMLPSRRRD